MYTPGRENGALKNLVDTSEIHEILAQRCLVLSERPKGPILSGEPTMQVGYKPRNYPQVCLLPDRGFYPSGDFGEDLHKALGGPKSLRHFGKA